MDSGEFFLAISLSNLCTSPRPKCIEVSSDSVFPAKNTLDQFSFRCVFLIPAESGEKITLAISTMFSLTVFLMNVDDGIPQTDKIPLISSISHISVIQLDRTVPNWMEGKGHL